MSKRKVFLVISICLVTLSAASVTPRFGNISGDTFEQLLKAAPKVTPRALQMALAALKRLQDAGTPVRSDRLMVIDYGKPSREARLWVFDLPQQLLLFEEPVAHGKNSGGDRSVRFSNEPGSLMSSLGVFLTGETYTGKHGLSLKLRGMEEGINDMALSRAIVIHGATYVSRSGAIGRSWGCPAVRPEISNALIESVRGGTLLLAYYPEQSWMKASKLTTLELPYTAPADIEGQSR